MDDSKSKMYRIFSTIDDDAYIGSTCQELPICLAKHKSEVNTKNKSHYNLYQKMREIGKEHFYIELLLDYPCENKQQSRQGKGKVLKNMEH